jgi:hypothetical protein
MTLDMEKHRQIALSVLRDMVTRVNSEITDLQARKEQLEGSIRALESAVAGGVYRASAIPDHPKPESLAAIVNRMEKAAEERDFPFEKLADLSRIEAAVEIARHFDGYLTTRAFALIIGNSGVLKGTKQLGSVASRILVHHSQFEKIAEGLFRLKSQEAPEGAS